MLHSDSSPSLAFNDINLRKIFECGRFKFIVSGWSKQTNKHTHTCEQCSHTSVELAQARPNYTQAT